MSNACVIDQPKVSDTAIVLVKSDDPDSKHNSDLKDMKSGGGAASKRRKAQRAVMMSKVLVGAKFNEVLRSLGTSRVSESGDSERFSFGVIHLC